MHRLRRNFWQSYMRTRNFVYGRDVIVRNDHKPLIRIMEKDLDTILSTKLQRMGLRYMLKLEYVPRKYLHIADLLSRYFNRDQFNTLLRLRT